MFRVQHLEHLVQGKSTSVELPMVSAESSSVPTQRMQRQCGMQGTTPSRKPPMISIPRDNDFYFLTPLFPLMCVQAYTNKYIRVFTQFHKAQSQMAVIGHLWEMPHDNEMKTLGPLLLIVLIFDLSTAALR